MQRGERLGGRNARRGSAGPATRSASTGTSGSVQPTTMTEHASYREVDRGAEDFSALVRAAVDELPLEFHRALEHVRSSISDRRHARRRAPTASTRATRSPRTIFHERIVIFRDTLMRDFGHDPELLRAQVTRTLRHELAHHLGWDERGVARTRARP